MFKKVLFIDDDLITINICQRLMKHVRFTDEFVFSTDGSIAKEYLLNSKHELPDIIFVDLHMTVMNGWEFLEWFNGWSASFEKPVPPVYVLSSSLSKEDFEKAHIYKVNGYITKPITIENLNEISKKFSV